MYDMIVLDQVIPVFPEMIYIISGTSIVGAGVRNQGSLRLNDMNVIASTGTPESGPLVQNQSGGSQTIEGDTNVRNDD